jgi:hypothetical protein
LSEAHPIISSTNRSISSDALIGRGFAESFHKLGHTVIIAGRRKDALDAVTAQNPGMLSAVLNVQHTAKLKYSGFTYADTGKTNINSDKSEISSLRNKPLPEENPSLTPSGERQSRIMGLVCLSQSRSA